jgi:hypothetical protein
VKNDDAADDLQKVLNKAAAAMRTIAHIAREVEILKREQARLQERIEKLSHQRDTSPFAVPIAWLARAMIDAPLSLQ